MRLKMINKLRKKIFWIIQISLSIIVLGIILVFTSFSYKNTITSSTMFMGRIEGREEIKEDRTKEFDEQRTNKDPFSIGIEGVYRLRIENGTIIRESNDVTDEIRNYAKELINKKTEEGYIGKYIYKIRKIGTNGKEITLMELIDELTNKKIEDAQNATQKLIQEEIEENKKLLMELKENNLRKKKC